MSLFFNPYFSPLTESQCDTSLALCMGQEACWYISTATILYKCQKILNRISDIQYTLAVQQWLDKVVAQCTSSNEPECVFLPDAVKSAYSNLIEEDVETIDLDSGGTPVFLLMAFLDVLGCNIEVFDTPEMNWKMLDQKKVHPYVIMNTVEANVLGVPDGHMVSGATSPIILLAFKFEERKTPGNFILIGGIVYIEPGYDAPGHALAVIRCNHQIGSNFMICESTKGVCYDGSDTTSINPLESWRKFKVLGATFIFTQRLQ